MIRVALPLLLLAACTAPAPPPSAAPRTTEDRQLEAVEEACRREATRIVLYRDRGQQMRLDEGDSRVGVQADIPTIRSQNYRFGQQVERDRIIRECVRANTAGPVPTDRPAPGAPPGSVRVPGRRGS